MCEEAISLSDPWAFQGGYCGCFNRFFRHQYFPVLCGSGTTNSTGSNLSSRSGGMSIASNPPLGDEQRENDRQRAYLQLQTRLTHPLSADSSLPDTVTTV